MPQLADGIRSTNTVRLPDGPDDTASVQTLRLLRGEGTYLIEQRQRYGRTFTLRPLHFPPLVVVSEPRLAQTLFTGDTASLHAGAANRILEPASGPQSVLFLDGDAHLARRRLLLSALQEERLPWYEQLIAEAIRSECDSWPLDEPIALHPRFRSVAADVMLKVVFGSIELDARSELKADLTTIQRGASRRKARATLSQVVSHLNGTERASSRVLTALLGTTKDVGRPRSQSAIVDELLALLVAGQETTAGTLAWAVERLSRYSTIQKRLRHALVDNDGSYVDAVISEILRSRPVLQWAMRLLTRPLPLGQWMLPDGAVVAVSIYLVHNDPELYPEPEQFYPERFISDHPSRAYTLIPFGGGVRRCLGARLAVLEIKVVLSHLLARFELRPPIGDAADEKCRRSGVTYVPAGGASVRLLPAGN